MHNSIRAEQPLEYAKVDDIVGGRFRLVEAVCADAFGTVFRAVDDRDGGSVHVRAIDPSQCVALGASTELLALARGPSAVRHPHLAALLDVVVENDRWYLVSESVDGESLAVHVSRDGRLDDVTAACIISEAASALIAVHSAGAVHGRLDPTRVVLSPSGVKVCDFGLGMLLGDDTEEWRTTLRDVEDPCVAFLSPEQARGDGPPRLESDVWSLCAVFYFALTGASPYAVKTRAAWTRPDARGDVRAPNGIDRRLGDALRRGLSPEPDLRPELDELIDALRPGRTVRWSRVAIAAIGAALVFAGIEFPSPPPSTAARSLPVEVATSQSPSVVPSISAAEPRIEKMSVPVTVATTPSSAAPVRRNVTWKPPSRDPFYGVTSAGF